MINITNINYPIVIDDSMYTLVDYGSVLDPSFGTVPPPGITDALGYSKSFATSNSYTWSNIGLNQNLEKEWQELKTLGDQYRQLEKTLLEKKQMWESLKAPDRK